MKKINGITDIFFDLDHTLWDFDKNSALTFEKIFALNNVSVDLYEFLRHYESINMSYWKLYREEKIDKPALRFGRLNDAFNAVKYVVSVDIINKLSDDYIEYLTTFNHLFLDALEILDYLKDNYNLHIITNGFSEVQKGKMDNSKISHYFKTITDSEMVGVKKPNAKIFEYALQLAETSASKSIMIGDNYEADILGAQNIGMHVIHFNIQNIKNDNGVYQISALKDLKHYL